jgi:orotidine-5'-phosphate decarboxylase
MPSPADLSARDRLIVALDVPTVEDAHGAVARLHNVAFFKIGYQLFVTGGVPSLLESLRGRRVFLDLKVPGDIANTIASVVDLCVGSGVMFLTLSESMPPAAVRAAKAARDARSSDIPKFLTVPLLSSLDAADVQEIAGESNLETYILRKAHQAMDNGCDGIIASGDAIRICRQAFPHPALIVSPGIRPDWAAANDHKRHTTPAEAIRLGADYLVVGRPILRSDSPFDAAARVIEEIDRGLAARPR